MKTLLTMSLLLTTGLLAQAQLTNSTITLTPNAMIADNNANGLLVTPFTVSGLAGTVTSVTVALDISGGFNGDLYAYLVSPQGQISVLLNRVGLAAGLPNGYSDHGFIITLDDSGSYGNIHNYTAAGGMVLGTFAADGRNLDPQSAGSAFDSTGSTLGLNNYLGTDPNGAWMFFFADLSAGGLSTLQNVTLSIMTVPEPQTWTLFLGGLALLGLVRRSRVG
jgi:subtilisin-like proprotein convertase family protein